MKYAKGIIQLFLCVLFFSEFSVQSQNMKLDGIKGESETRDYKEWIDILSFKLTESVEKPIYCLKFI